MLLIDTNIIPCYIILSITLYAYDIVVPACIIEVKKILNNDHAMQQDLLTPEEAAKLKGVTKALIYAAIADGRLPHVRVLGRLGLRKEDVLAWELKGYAGRPGPKAGYTRGPVSAETKARISEAQKRRWAQRQQSR